MLDRVPDFQAKSCFRLMRKNEYISNPCRKTESQSRETNPPKRYVCLVAFFTGGDWAIPSGLFLLSGEFFRRIEERLWLGEKNCVPG